jgi:hypothetical protein
MALITFKSFVFPVELKTGRVMIKFFGLPVIENVAAGTIIFTVFFKLSVMNILVAIGARLTGPGKLLIQSVIGSGVKVAVPAAYLVVFSFKLKVCV